MKGHSLLFVCLFAVLCAFSSCDNKSMHMDETHSTTNNVLDSISLQTFMDWKRNWTRYGQDYTADTLTRYFTMPIIDLKEVIGEQADSARFYLGLDTTVSPRYPHIMLVGVDSTGKDLIDYNNGLYAYDVSSPCPPVCEGR